MARVASAVGSGLGELLRTSRRSIIPGVVVVGLLVTLAASWWLWGSEQTEARIALDTRRQIVVDSTERALSDATLRLTAVAGLYQSSEEVTRLEFRRFVRNLGLLPGMEAIGYMPFVMGRNREAFEAEMAASTPGYFIYEIDVDGTRIPAADRRIHVPLQWYEPIEPIEPTERIEGFDSMSDERRGSAIEVSRITRDVAATPFLRLLSEEESDGFVLYWPVTDAETDALVGYAAAAMDLSKLMDSAVSESFTQLLDWEVVDATGGSTDAAVSTSRIEVGGRIWEIGITPAPASDMTPSPRAPLLLMATGLLATAFVAGALHNQRRHIAARREFERLRELTQAKDQFLASVGHELRTPLTSVLGFAELLRADTTDLSEEERVSMISSVADEATDLAAIVDDLLVAARSELDLLVVTEMPVSTRAQVAQVIELSGRDACETIQVIGEPGNPYRALGDPSRVRQILRNLITNACRYGGGQVQVRLSSTDDSVSIVVADDGSGVPAEDSEQIFVPYYRAHSNESQPAALGIGLSVARQLARLMNGDLTYRREYGWTVFELLLPAVGNQKAESTGNRAATEPQPDHSTLRVP